MTLPIDKCYLTAKQYYGLVQCDASEVKIKYYTDEDCMDHTGMTDSYTIGDPFVSRHKVTLIQCGHKSYDLVRAINEPSEYQFNRLSLYLTIASGSLLLAVILLGFFLCHVGCHKKRNKVRVGSVRSSIRSRSEEMI